MLLLSSYRSLVVKTFTSFSMRVMENSHHLKQGAAKPGEFRNDKDILLMHPLNEGAEFSIRVFFLLLIVSSIQRPMESFFSCLEDFKPLVFRGLFVGRNPDISVDHIGS